MNKLKKIFNPIAQVAIWAFIAVIYLGGGKVNIAINNGLILLLLVVLLSILYKIKGSGFYMKLVDSLFYSPITSLILIFLLLREKIFYGASEFIIMFVFIILLFIVIFAEEEKQNNHNE